MTIRTTEVSVEEFDAFRIWYFKNKGKSTTRTKQGPESVIIIDKATKTSICIESHRLGRSTYRIKTDAYTEYCSARTSNT